MSVTPASQLRKILPAVITGGRPALSQRPTAKFLPELHGITADPVWIVRDDHAPAYERDGHELAVYTQEWAEEYASAHWTGLEPFKPGAFLGAFPGREWACRLAEERGYWGVLQLDDNIKWLHVFRHRSAAMRITEAAGGLGMYADILSAVTLSTNGAMTGAFLSAVRPSRKNVVSRTGFPYSLFLERIDPGREEWYGPFEDDITHAYQYGSNATKSTALVVPLLNYIKESKSGTGMRKAYDSRRSVPLQRMFPETAKIGVRKTRSNGKGEGRVFHTMIPGAIRTPMVITDHDLYGQVSAHLASLARKYADEARTDLSVKVARRAARAGGA